MTADANTYYLNDYLHKQDELEVMTEMARHRAKDAVDYMYQMLAITNMYGSEWHKEPGYNCAEAIANLQTKVFEDIGKALYAKQYETVGKLLEKAIKAKFYDDAKYQVEEELGIRWDD